MAVTGQISLAVAAVPESLPAVVTLSLDWARGGWPPSCDRPSAVRGGDLGSVTVLATDKTGTLTEGAMVVEEVWTPRGRATVTGTGYRPKARSVSGPGGGAAGRESLRAVSSPRQPYATTPR